MEVWSGVRCPPGSAQRQHQQGYHRREILPIQARALPLTPLRDPKSPWDTAQMFHAGPFPWMPPAWQGHVACSGSCGSARDSPEQRDQIAPQGLEGRHLRVLSTEGPVPPGVRWLCRGSGGDSGDSSGSLNPGCPA